MPLGDWVTVGGFGLFYESIIWIATKVLKRESSSLSRMERRAGRRCTLDSLGKFYNLDLKSCKNHDSLFRPEVESIDLNGNADKVETKNAKVRDWWKRSLNCTLYSIQNYLMRICLCLCLC